MRFWTADIIKNTDFRKKLKVTFLSQYKCKQLSLIFLHHPSQETRTSLLKDLLPKEQFIKIEKIGALFLLPKVLRLPMSYFSR